MKVYTIEAQKPGVHQSRFTVSHEDLPTQDKSFAEFMAASWSQVHPFEYRVVENEMTFVQNFPWIKANR